MPWALQVIDQARNKLRINCSPVQIPIGLEHEHEGLVDLLDMKAYHFGGIFGEIIKEVRPQHSLCRQHLLASEIVVPSLCSPWCQAISCLYHLLQKSFLTNGATLLMKQAEV